MQRRTCPHCETPQPLGARYCAECGADLDRYTSPPGWRRSIELQLAVEAAAVICAVLAVVLPSEGLGLAVLLYPVALALAAYGIQCGPRDVATASRRDRRLLDAASRLGGFVLATILLAPAAVYLNGFRLYSRSAAGQSQSLSNLRKLGQAMLHYAEDNDGHLPGWVRGSDGRLYHNVWDQQIAPYVGDAKAYIGLCEPRGIRSPSQPGVRSRILSYGLNGLLITKPKRVYDGNADRAAGPGTSALSQLRLPGDMILLAELATDRSMGDPYLNPPVPPGVVVTGETRRYRHALNQWIDIDPRAWVETRGPVDSYRPESWDSHRGVARDDWGMVERDAGGGGCYVFADGHVQFLHLHATVRGLYLRDAARRRRPGSAFRPDNVDDRWHARWYRPAP